MAEDQSHNRAQGPREPTVLFVTGLSGSGKSTAVEALEDLGYFCVDNLPAPLIPDVIDYASQDGQLTESLALVVDVRGRQICEQAFEYIEDAKKQIPGSRLLFLEATETQILERYRETRRRHPMGGQKTVRDGIRQERQLLKPLRHQADATIDTTSHTVHTLKQLIRDQWGLGKSPELRVTILSFGFKHELPTESDLVFDVRFLPNPHFVEHLKPSTGKDPQVRDYVFSSGEATTFTEHVENLLGFTLPRYVEEGKSYLTIGIGCTGGQHRSVAVAEELGRRLEGQGWDVHVRHRDAEFPEQVDS